MVSKGEWERTWERKFEDDIWKGKMLWGVNIVKQMGFAETSKLEGVQIQIVEGCQNMVHKN